MAFLLPGQAGTCVPKIIKKRNYKPLLINRQDIPERIVKFPESGWATGHIFLFRLFRDSGMIFLGEPIQDLGPAKSTIKLPKGKCAGLVLTPEGYARLEEFKNLLPNDFQILFIQCMPFKSADLQKFQHLTGLEKVHLSLTPVDDSVFSEIAKFPNLWSVIIVNSMITGKNIGELNKLKKLGVLDLSNNMVTDDYVKEIANNRTIYSLSLNSSKITSKAADYIVQMKQLKGLGVNTPKFGDAGVLKLRELKNLRVLKIGKNQVSQKCLQEFRRARPKCRILKTTVEPIE